VNFAIVLPNTKAYMIVLAINQSCFLVYHVLFNYFL